MTRLLIFAAVVAAVAAGRSPNYDSVQELLRSSPSVYPRDVVEDASLDVPGLISKYGYPVEVHEITTSDGYILQVHRIPHGRDQNNQPGKRPVAFLMHGLLSSSADYLVLGPGNALGYVLAEAGYDVWLGNARGNRYSRRHTSMNPNRTSFWRFSWDEIGNLDLPAMIDFILASTGESKLHYIGHSQGGTTFFVLNSLKPEYNEKFISFQGLAPAAFFTNNENEMFNSLAPYGNVLETMAFTAGIGEIFGSDDFTQWLQDSYCSDSARFLSSLCGFLSINGDSLSRYNQTMAPVFMAHAPAGASIRQVAHYGQVIRDDRFRRYDHGAISNRLTYGQRSPPEYDLSKVTTPSYIHYGMTDGQVDYRDIYILASKLGNVVGTYRTGGEDFNHFDFIWGANVKTLLYDRVLDLMREAESN